MIVYSLYIKDETPFQLFFEMGFVYSLKPGIARFFLYVVSVDTAHVECVVRIYREE